MGREAVKQFSASQILLAVAAFLTPLIGGQIATDQIMPLEPGLGALLKAMLGGPFLQGMETPLMSHFLLAGLVGAATIIALAKRPVIQLPNVVLLIATVAFFGILMLSMGVSSFKFTTLATLSEWLSYALAFFAMVTLAGRQSGPRVILTALYAGVVVMAIYGVRFEYLPISGSDPTYRIFAGWNNPNAAASMLLVGLIIGLSLSSNLSRGPALIVGLCNVIIGLALMLTGSKGGFAALFIGVAAFALLTVLWGKGPQRFVRVGVTALTVILVLVAYVGLQAKNAAHTKAGGGLGRVAAYDSTQAQSLEFRKLLWKGAIKTAIEHPTGYGLGTYRYEGSRSGDTTLTTLAHENLLQLWVEATFLAPILLLTMIAIWLYFVFRGARSMPDSQNALRAGVVAAAFAAFAQGVFESNLYYYGLGLAFFMLLGLGLNLSADSVAPEFTPKGARTALALLASLPILALGYVGYTEWQMTQVRYLVSQGQGEAARETVASVVSIAPTYGEGWYTLHLLDPARRAEAIQKAAELSPSPRVYRALARYYEVEKKYSSALAAIDDALGRDPNNLPALSLGMQLSIESGNPDDAKKYAERMVAVEATPYFKIRSLPEMVETATCEARIYLASLEKAPARKTELLQPALDLYDQYALVTVPTLKRFAEEGQDYAGQTAEDAIKQCTKGREIAKMLVNLYKSLGEPSKAKAAEDADADLAKALESLQPK